ncbi:MAG: diol dehydratase reactivase subunit alpha [Eubacterium sp.]|nr:diol dehydratase reactivase subunit alpha [Eubacterium sp.]
MRIVAGVDIGNSTTEVALGQKTEGAPVRFLASAAVKTTGTKGTLPNIHGIRSALQQACAAAGIEIRDITTIRLNEAAPVIGDTAMETLTETVITDSTMIGHNPGTPAGAGTATGRLLSYEKLDRAMPETDYIVFADKSHGYEEVSRRLNSLPAEVRLKGVILQADEAVLVWNRLNRKVPIIDEVARIDKVPEGKLAAIEVAMAGQSVQMLSNPYGIATLLGLTPDETREVTPIAKSLVGNRSAVVIKTEGGEVQENVLPAGKISLKASNPVTIDLDEGAVKIMGAVENAGDVYDIEGEPDTNVGRMFDRIKGGMENISGRDSGVHITDILAVDTLAPVLISGALAGETCLEKAVGIAAMVRTQQLPMQQIAQRLESELGVRTKVAGVEAVMATLGALTTPGTQLPLAILDMGGGSTDAAVIHTDGSINLTHQAGAGELVSMLIQTELGLGERYMAEQIKRYPLAKVESLFHMRLETGEMQFVQESLDPRFYGRVVMITPNGLIRVDKDIPMERIRQVRREAKEKVFLVNAVRALRKVAPDHDLKKISNVVLVGGSALDFEIPEMLTRHFAEWRIVCGRGNIRGTEGPRNAVATGLVLSDLD